VAATQKKAEAKALLSLEEHMEKLAALRDSAEAANQYSAAIAAKVKRGELRLHQAGRARASRRVRPHE
jgi:hypothetical protein